MNAMQMLSGTGKRRCLTISMVCLVGLAGCEQHRQSESFPVEETVPYLSSTELNRKLHSGKPVLVEFCVPRGCFRCSEMGVQIATLAERLGDHVDVVRVNLNSERAFALDLGITICPTYIAFAGGEELFRAPYPTSGHLLLAKLDEFNAQP